MTIVRRALLIAIPLALLASASAPNAAPKGSWDGTWSGMWENQYDTAIVIAGNKVVSYSYRGYNVPFTHAKVTADSVLITREYSVTLTKTSDTTATAKYHGTNGDFTADMTRQ
jgi:hypothetical protein